MQLIERAIVEAAYRECGGDVRAIARTLGFNRTHAYTVLRRHGLAFVDAAKFKRRRQRACVAVDVPGLVGLWLARELPKLSDVQQHVRTNREFA